MKKNLNVILLGCSAFLILVNFALMAAPGLKLGSLASSSVYNLIGNGHTLDILAMVFGIVALLIIAFVCLVELKIVKFAYAHFCALGAALLLLLAGIFFFCTATGDYKGLDLGVGAILCGIFDLLAFCLTGFYGVTKVLNK